MMGRARVAVLVTFNFPCGEAFHPHKHERTNTHTRTHTEGNKITTRQDLECRSVHAASSRNISVQKQMYSQTSSLAHGLPPPVLNRHELKRSTQRPGAGLFCGRCHACCGFPRGFEGVRRTGALPDAPRAWFPAGATGRRLPPSGELLYPRITGRRRDWGMVIQGRPFYLV